MKVAFNDNGLPMAFGETVDLYAPGTVTVGEVPDGTDMWRVSYNAETSSVVIRYDGLSNEEAHAQNIADEEAAAANG